MLIELPLLTGNRPSGPKCEPELSTGVGRRRAACCLVVQGAPYGEISSILLSMQPSTLHHDDECRVVGRDAALIEALVSHNSLPRTCMSTRLPPLDSGAALANLCREPRACDIGALGRLMYRAFLDAIDYEGESEIQAVTEVGRTFSGEHGMFLPEYSRVIERDGRLVSATLVTRLQDRPLIAFSMTDPDCRREGLARACLLGAMWAMHAAGEVEVGLVVTSANSAALNLYQQLGFVVES